MSARQERTRPDLVSLPRMGEVRDLRVIPSHDPPLYDGELLRTIHKTPSPDVDMIHLNHRVYRIHHEPWWLLSSNGRVKSMAEKK